MLVKTLRTNSVFGCFLTAPIFPDAPTQSTMNGSFCFKLDGNEATFYPVVGSIFDTMSSSDSNSKMETDFRSIKMTEPTRTYTKFTENELVIGTSFARSSNATNSIRFIDNFKMCYSGASDTFCNPPLTEEVSPFPVECVEVFVGPWVSE